MLRLSSPVLNCTVAGLLMGALAAMAQTPDALQLSRSLGRSEVQRRVRHEPAQ